MKYIYFKLYQVISRIKTNNSPAFSAMCLISVFEFMNFVTVTIIICYINKIKITNTYDNAKIMGLSFTLVMFCINHFVLSKNHSKICKKYEHESKNKSNKGFVILTIYILCTLTLLFTLGPLLN